MAGVEACQNLPKERYAMNDDTTIIPASPAGFDHRPVDRDRPRGRAPHADGGAEGRGRELRRPVRRRAVCPTGASASSGTAPGRSGRSRPGSGRSRCSGRRCATARPTCRPRRGSGSPRTSCRDGRGARRASMPCCRCFTCAASPPAISRRRLAALLGDGRAEPVARRHLAPHRRLAGGLRPLAAPRSLGAPLRLHLGRRRLPPGPDGAAGRVHPRDHRGDAGGQEGAARLPGRGPRERAELARAAGRPQGPRAGRAARAGRRRRRPGVLEGARRGLPRHPPPAVLVPQDLERAQPLPESHAAGRRAPTCAISITPKPGPPRWPPSRPSRRNTASNTPAR